MFAKIKTIWHRVAHGLRLYFNVGVALVRAESPEEQARAQKVLAGAIVGGAIMALAKPIAYWLVGDFHSLGLPDEVVSMMDSLLTLLQGVGIVALIAGLIYGGIQLRHH